MIFLDRTDAGRQLAVRLQHLRHEDVVVLGLPRGGVPVAFEVAQELGAPLDVVLVRKLGVPFQPELAMGAIGEGGVRVLDRDTLRLAKVGPAALCTVEEKERAELARRADRFRGGRPPIPLVGRTAVIVDDGLATGSTARAACEVVRARGAAHVVLAVPVASQQAEHRLGSVADEIVCLVTPRPFDAIGRWYLDFAQTTDAEVVDCLARAGSRPAVVRRSAVPAADDIAPVLDEEVDLAVDGVRLQGHLTVPEGAIGAVVFAHGSGSGRHSPRNRFVAKALNRAGLGTLLFDLLTPEEEARYAAVFDIGLLARRLVDATCWLRTQPEAADLAIGWFGASTGAAAALLAAAEPDADVAAVATRGGRPDLVGASLAAVRAPTLLIVGSCDPGVLDLNRQAQMWLRCENRLAVVPGAGHLFEEPGTLQAVADLAAEWFGRHLVAEPVHGQKLSS